MKKLLSLLTGLIIFCILPFIGWGIHDLSGFIRCPYRLSFIVMMAVLSVVVVLVVPNEGRGYGEGQKLIMRQKLTIRFLQIVPVLILLISPFFDRHRIGIFNESDAIRVIGIILSLIGFLMMNWSVTILGRQFSVDVTIQENHQLITTGPYKYIRHPRYLGIIVFLTGIPIVFLSWIPLILDLILIILLLWRISDEEKLMLQEFQSDWEAYKKRTCALLPFIY